MATENPVNKPAKPHTPADDLSETLPETDGLSPGAEPLEAPDDHAPGEEKPKPAS